MAGAGIGFLGLAVLGAVLINVSSSKLASSLVGLGPPREQANSASRQGGGSATGPIPPAVENAVKTDFAAAIQKP